MLNILIPRIRQNNLFSMRLMGRTFCHSWLFFDRKTDFYALKVKHILCSPSCAYFMTIKNLYLLSLSWVKKNDTFWPENDIELTCSMSNLASFQSLILGISDKGSLVTVRCLVQIYGRFYYPYPIKFLCFGISAFLIHILF